MSPSNTSKNLFRGNGSPLTDSRADDRMNMANAVMSPVLPSGGSDNPTSDEYRTDSADILRSLAVAANSTGTSLSNDEGFKLKSPYLFTMLANAILKEGKYYLCVSEAVRNSVESSEGLPHSVTVDVHPIRGAKGKILGIRITDNGCGMDADEMLANLSDPGQSGKRTGVEAHLGFGMKLVAAYLNERVEIVSWKNGQAFKMVYGILDAPTNSRGVISQPWNGGMLKVIPCEIPAGVEGFKSESGTQVDLIGGIERYNSQQIASFLSNRFFTFVFPDARADSLVRVWNDQRRVKTPNTETSVRGTSKMAATTVRGVLQNIAEDSLLSRTVEGKVARYTWGIEKDPRTKTNLATVEMVSRSNTARIFYGWRDEAYHHGVQASLVEDWGITHGAHRFKLVVEFLGEVTPDPVRTRLDAFKELRIAARDEWKNLMPSEVKQFIEEQKRISQEDVVSSTDTQPIVSSWYGEESATISVDVRSEPLPLNPATSRTGMQPPASGTKGGKKGKGGKGGGNGGESNPPANAEQGVKESEESGGKTSKRKAKEHSISFVAVSFDPDLGDEPLQYSCIVGKEHRLVINPHLGPIKRLLDVANNNQTAKKNIQTLLAAELQMRVDKFIRETQQLPSSEVMLALVTTALFADVSLKDKDAIRIPKKRK